jgi:hypothetical protein
LGWPEPPKRGQRKKSRIQGCLTWTAGFAILLIAVPGIFLAAKPDVAHAMRDFFDVVTTFARVEREIMLPTPYGRYYSDLYFENYAELKQILATHPSYRDDMVRLMYLFMPHIEAVLDGRGDEVRITQEQVDQLESFMYEIRDASDGKLRTDIDRELSRTPLQDFVGLSMDETLVYIEKAWERDFSVPATPAPTEWERESKTLTP